MSNQILAFEIFGLGVCIAGATLFALQCLVKAFNR